MYYVNNNGGYLTDNSPAPNSVTSIGPYGASGVVGLMPFKVLLSLPATATNG